MRKEPKRSYFAFIYGKTNPTNIAHVHLMNEDTEIPYLSIISLLYTQVTAPKLNYHPN